MANTWEVSLGSLWRGFKTQGNRAAQLVKQGTLTMSDDGTLELAAKYDPPGSGWFALLAAIVTGILVTVIAQATGGCAGPGWLLWFIIIALMRRRTVNVNLQNSDAVVVDSPNRRLAFHTNFEGKQRWIAFDVIENFDSAAQRVRALMPSRCADGKIDRGLSSSSIVLLVLLVLFAVLIAFSIVAFLIWSSRSAPVMR